MALPESAINFMNRQVERVRQAGGRKRIVFPEGSDPRVLEAAGRLAREGLADPILLGKPPAGAPAGVTFVQPETSPHLQKYAALYHERRRAKGLTQMEAAEIARKPEYFGQLMVSAGDADGSVCGAVYTSKDTLRAMLHCIGTAPRVRLITSLFVLAVRNRQFGHNGLLGVCDASIMIEPSAVELADMAITTAGTVRVFFETEPIVALLSYSTRGSGGRHKEVEKVVEALRIVRARAPELNVGWRDTGGCGARPGRGNIEGAGLDRCRPRQYPDLPRPDLRQHRRQDGGAPGRRRGHRPLRARPGQTRQ